jgi:WD40 repeat protein
MCVCVCVHMRVCMHMCVFTHTVSYSALKVSEFISVQGQVYFLCSLGPVCCVLAVSAHHVNTLLSEMWTFVSCYGLHVCRDGSVRGWSSQSGQQQFCQPYSHSGDVVAVDMCGSVVVSGSHDKTVKFWQVSEQGLIVPKSKIDVGDRIWSLSVQPQGDICCIGSAGYHQVPPLHVFDMER